MQSCFRNEKVLDYGSRIRSPIRCRRRNRLTVVVGVLFFLFLFYHCNTPQHHSIRITTDLANPPCPTSPISNDILVVMRTGTTEALSKLPVHFSTTLSCVPDYIIYSDYEEDIQGQHVHDVFEGISPSLKASVPEFKLYEQLQKHGREALSSTTTTNLGSGPSGSQDNLAWKLDRFKFLPMVDKALRHRPDAKWFVFIEADTYLVWQNLLEYLALFDAEKPFYIGKHMYIGEELFAHGGSGFVLSAAAMKKVTNRWRKHVDEYDAYTARMWAGDFVLGKALRDVGVELFWAFPHFQGEPVSSIGHNVSMANKTPWCYAPITYHHMHEDDIRKLWAFEQERGRLGKTGLRHGDLFKEYILPKLAAKADDWDNLSMDTESGDAGPFEKCQIVCEAKPGCLQFSYTAGKCSTSSEIVLGNEAKTRCLEYSAVASRCLRWDDGAQFAGSIQSGWMMERVTDYVKDMDSLCHDGAKHMWVV